MNYSDNTASCRVDFYKEKGKWYTTEAIVFPADVWELDPREALRISLRKQIGTRLHDMIAVCVEPCVKHSFPALLREGDR